MNTEPMRKKRRSGTDLQKYMRSRAVHFVKAEVDECPSGKYGYATKESAQRAVDRWDRKGVALHFYRHGKAKGGCGMYHLTSSTGARG
jgi:hypothetical protein